MQCIQPADLRQSQFHLVQSRNRPSLVRLVRPDAAERHRMCDAALFQRLRDGFRHAVLMRAEIGTAHVRRNQRVHALRPRKRPAQGIRIENVCCKRVRTPVHKRRQFFVVPADHADSLTLVEQLPGNHRSCVSRRSQNDIHGFLRILHQ